MKISRLMLLSLLILLAAVLLPRLHLRSVERELLVIGPMPPPVEAVSLDEVVRQWAKKGMTLYLPTELPKGLKLMAVYAKVKDGEIGNMLIVVYSNRDDASIPSAELSIEIIPLSGFPYHIVDPSRQRFIEIGDWRVYLDVRARVGWREYHKKY